MADAVCVARVQVSEVEIEIAYQEKLVRVGAVVGEESRKFFLTE